ncbi:MAG TPA: hypothetical protein DD725_06055 [Deltaproteobacteria bacterium]|nr:hypothetical protein [Deltaproteobacteria bacterium]
MIGDREKRVEKKTHKDLDVWKKSLDLAEMIYNITKEFPQEEKFLLVDQLRRAAVRARG